MADTLGDPETDSHGDPIPGVGLEPLGEDNTRPLSEFDVGDTVVVARVRDRDEDELAYLAEAGTVPGRELVVEERAPIKTNISSILSNFQLDESLMHIKPYKHCHLDVESN